MSNNQMFSAEMHHSGQWQNYSSEQLQNNTPSPLSQRYQNYSSILKENMVGFNYQSQVAHHTFRHPQSSNQSNRLERQASWFFPLDLSDQKPHSSSRDTFSNPFNALSSSQFGQNLASPSATYTKVDPDMEWLQLFDSSTGADLDGTTQFKMTSSVIARPTATFHADPLLFENTDAQVHEPPLWGFMPTSPYSPTTDSVPQMQLDLTPLEDPKVALLTSPNKHKVGQTYNAVAFQCWGNTSFPSQTLM